MPRHFSMIQLCFVQTVPLALGGRETFPSKEKKKNQHSVLRTTTFYFYTAWDGLHKAEVCQECFTCYMVIVQSDLSC